MNSPRSLLLTLCALVALAAPARAQEVKIKLGTLAPQGSTWHTLLNEMGQRWLEASGGKVVLKVYAGGTQGNEGEMMRKMAIGQLHAASVTTLGLREITPEPQAEDVPGLLDSEGEYEYVHARMEPEFNAALEKKGYVAINWAEVGFVYLFSTEPYKTPADFGKGKVFSWNGDPESEKAWKKAGFHPVVLSSTDLITSLQTNMINITGQPPLYAFTTNVFAKADNMLDLKWGFLTGATVVRKDTWEKIDPVTRAKLLAIAKDVGAKVVTDVRKQNEEALAQMKAKGLRVNTPEKLDEWKGVYATIESVVRGTVTPAATYDKVKALRDEYRAQQKKK